MDLPNTDDMDSIMVLLVARLWIASWEDDVRIIGNIRAKDLLKALDEIIPIKEGKFTYEYLVDYIAEIIDPDPFEINDPSSVFWGKKEKEAKEKAMKILTKLRPNDMVGE